ncbi:TrkA C-terminal domain-containing protein [Spirochaeta lutea]|uniref:RCK C-terminal domain-containing protein n=1 Tax=Spirochaeta lutea TaxID=1480694 RepID=A0A098R2J8_9SPIO|nr:TrkA C-terminal domain-containing protein [Spirochaeta lutea]KGE73878.1 hypothetical protein DC28_01355 [Spirochaeta lutea]
MYAKRKGVQRVIALVNKVGYTSITQELGIDVAVSMNTTTVKSILKRIRKGNARSIHTISESKFVIIELSIVDNCPVLGQAIKSLRFPKDSLILMVTRDGKNIIPRGDLTFQTGDHVVVISHQSTISALMSYSASYDSWIFCTRGSFGHRGHSLGFYGDSPAHCPGVW